METIDLLLLEFDKDAKLVHPDQLIALKTSLNTGNFTDLLVLSHGWNNNDNEAKSLYNRLLRLSEKEIASRPASGKKFLALGVIWPSKKFGDPDTSNSNTAGGAASTTSTSGNTELAKQANSLSDIAQTPATAKQLTEIAKLISANAKAPRLAEAFTDLFETFKNGDTKPKENEEKFPDFTVPEIQAMLTDSGYWDDGLPPADTGGSVSLPPPGYGYSMSLFSGIKDSMQNLLNLTTYYMMKDRSGLVGRKGLNPVLAKLIKAYPTLKIHLVGHSFGARLVSSAILGEEIANQIKVDSLSLLQAAFSHYAFAKEYKRSLDGLFRPVVAKQLVKGAFIITHSRKDKAVGIAYAVASRLARQIASGIGGKNDPYGGLGGNGAQVTPEVEQLKLNAANKPYSFKPGKVYNLESDEFIFGHSEISVAEVSNALVSAFGIQKS
ncbi:hypothetical protein [Pedobacter aquatilis]|uniref:hypothetical protein n=1 Tax=Pedobacter aquatilis TaxID=351343 RepID=UPI00292D262D|nr:hypothetical protein [Pedobacter aquatilis]